jgi:2-polyprenyl-6-methoxyphenol hydroxylase-like FAD-dependent oxidoreductase
VLHVFRDFDPWLLALFTKANTATIKVWQLLDMETLPTWTSGKFALMGDAAHPCLPCKLHTYLAAVLPLGTTAAEVPERLKLYETIRFKRAFKIQEYSRLTGQDWVDGQPVVDSKSD